MKSPVIPKAALQQLRELHDYRSIFESIELSSFTPFRMTGWKAAKEE